MLVGVLGTGRGDDAATISALAHIAGFGRRAVRSVVHRVLFPSRPALPYVMPGVAPLLRAHWGGTVLHAPVMTVEEHAAATGLGEIE